MTIERMKELALKLFSLRRLMARYALVLFALVLVVIYILHRNKLAAENKPPVPAYVALKCSKCGHVEDCRMSSLDDAGLACSECEGKLGYRLKCEDCDFEFAFFPNNYDTVECIKGLKRRTAITLLLNQRICPNCGGPKTFHVNPQKRDNVPGSEVRAE